MSRTGIRGVPRLLFRQASLSPRFCDDGSQLLIHVEDSQFAPYYAASLVEQRYDPIMLTVRAC